MENNEKMIKLTNEMMELLGVTTMEELSKKMDRVFAIADEIKKTAPLAQAEFNQLKPTS